MKRVTFVAKKVTATDRRLATAARMWYTDGNQMSDLFKFLTYSKGYQIRCIANGLEGWNDTTTAFEYPQQILRLSLGMAKDVSYRRDNPSMRARTDVLPNLTHSEMVDLITKAATRLQSGLRAAAIAKHLGYKGKISVKPLARDSKLIFEDGSCLHFNRLVLKRVQINNVEAKAAKFIKEQRIRTKR